MPALDLRGIGTKIEPPKPDGGQSSKRDGIGRLNIGKAVAIQ